MCPEWAKLAEHYGQALNAHKIAAIRLRGLKDREYESAWLKTRDTALRELQEHQRQHGC